MWGRYLHLFTELHVIVQYGGEILLSKRNNTIVLNIILNSGLAAAHKPQ